MQGYDTTRKYNEHGEKVEIIEVVVHRAFDGSFGLEVNDKRRIVSISPGCPADFAGMKPYDLILTLDGEPLNGVLRCAFPASLTHPVVRVLRHARRPPCAGPLHAELLTQKETVTLKVERPEVCAPLALGVGTGCARKLCCCEGGSPASSHPVQKSCACAPVSPAAGGEPQADCRARDEAVPEAHSE